MQETRTKGFSATTVKWSCTAYMSLERKYITTTPSVRPGLVAEDATSQTLRLLTTGWIF